MHIPQCCETATTHKACQSDGHGDLFFHTECSSLLPWLFLMSCRADHGDASSGKPWCNWAVPIIMRYGVGSCFFQALDSYPFCDEHRHDEQACFGQLFSGEIQPLSPLLSYW